MLNTVLAAANFSATAKQFTQVGCWSFLRTK